MRRLLDFSEKSVDDSRRDISFPKKNFFDLGLEACRSVSDDNKCCSAFCLLESSASLLRVRKPLQFFIIKNFVLI